MKVKDVLIEILIEYENLGRNRSMGPCSSAGEERCLKSHGGEGNLKTQQEKVKRDAVRTRERLPVCYGGKKKTARQECMEPHQGDNVTNKLNGVKDP